MGKRCRDPDARCCPKHKFLSSGCSCGADVYKKIFGPTLDESLFVLILAILELMDLWKRTAGDEEVSDECNDEWDEFTETSASPLACEEECCNHEPTKPCIRKRKSRYS